MNLFIKFLPAILQAILAVQAALPTIKGATKKQLVLRLLTLGTGVAEALPEEHVAELGGLIDGSVQILRDEGVFAKDSVPVTLAPLPALLPAAA